MSSLYNDFPNDKNYVVFNKGELIGLRNACEEIRQITLEDGIRSGGICYILSSIIELAPIIENNFSIKELEPKNGIRQFEVINKAKDGAKKIVELKIGKKPGFPKSTKGIDIQVLLEYLKKEIEEADQDLIEAFSNLKPENAESIFENNKIDQNLLEYLLLEIGDNYDDYKKKF